jgi:hypothetical protein
MEVTQEGNKLVIKVEMHPPRPSASGITKLVASERAITTVKVDGKAVQVQLNAYIK